MDNEFNILVCDSMGETYLTNKNGFIRKQLKTSRKGENIEEMTYPVKCMRCGDVYDLGKVKDIIHRYTDCTMYKSPCCNQIVDDRTSTFFKSNPDIEVIDLSKLTVVKF